MQSMNTISLNNGAAQSINSAKRNNAWKRAWKLFLLYGTAQQSSYVTGGIVRT